MSNEKAEKYLESEYPPDWKGTGAYTPKYAAKATQSYANKETASLKERLEKEFRNQMQIEYDIVKKHYSDGLYKDGVFEGLRLAKVIFNELLTNNQQSDGK